MLAKAFIWITSLFAYWPSRTLLSNCAKSGSLLSWAINSCSWNSTHNHPLNDLYDPLLGLISTSFWLTTGCWKKSSTANKETSPKWWKVLHDSMLELNPRELLFLSLIFHLLLKLLSDCNWTRTHNHLVNKWTLNYLTKLIWTKWLWFRVQLQSLKLQISCLLRLSSSLTFRQLQSWIRSEMRTWHDKNLQ